MLLDSQCYCSRTVLFDSWIYETFAMSYERVAQIEECSKLPIPTQERMDR